MTAKTLDQKLEAALAVLDQACALAAEASGRVAFSTSLGAEDQLLLALIVERQLPVELFTLDTGRLNPETLALLAQTEAHFRKRIQVYAPDQAAVEHYVRINGINGFYESISQRKDCCQIRKTDQLKRALKGVQVWITGLRREQSQTREGLEPLAFDAGWQLHKAAPLADFTEAEVWQLIRDRGIPYNPLHDQGYPSIGCAPCTRAIQPGEDVRAGRWWWESAEHKECGLHVRPV